MKNKLSKKTKQSILLFFSALIIGLIPLSLCLFPVFSAPWNDSVMKKEMPYFLSGKNAEKGSFENPYNAKKSINIIYEDYQYFPKKNNHAKGDFKITLKSVIKGNKAYKYLKTLDKENIKPEKGYQWLVLKFDIKYKDGNIKNDFDASYLINPYSNFFNSEQEKITSFSKYRPLFGNKEYTNNILRTGISLKETKSLWTAIMVKDDWFPIYYRICTGYTGKGEDKAPVYEWFKIK